MQNSRNLKKHIKKPLELIHCKLCKFNDNLMEVTCANDLQNHQISKKFNSHYLRKLSAKSEDHREIKPHTYANNLQSQDLIK